MVVPITSFIILSKGQWWPIASQEIQIKRKEKYSFQEGCRISVVGDFQEFTQNSELTWHCLSYNPILSRRLDCAMSKDLFQATFLWSCTILLHFQLLDFSVSIWTSFSVPTIIIGLNNFGDLDVTVVHMNKYDMWENFL